MLARRVLKNTIYNGLSILLANVVGVAVTIYVARALKPELFGIYSLALSIAFFLLTFTDLGLNTTLIRYVAHSYGNGDYELVRGYVKSLSKLKISLVFLVSILLFFLSDYISITVFKKPMLSKPLKVVSIFITFFSLAGFVNSIFNAFNDFKANFVRSLFYEISRLVLIVLFVSMGLSVVGALLGFTVASLISLVALAVLLIRKYGKIVFGKAKAINWKRIVRFSSYLTLGSITWVVFAYVDSIMIGIFLPAEDVGYYRAAYNIVGAISGLVSIPTVLFPVFVQLEGRDLKNAFYRAFKYSAIISFPIALGLPVVSKPLIKFIYGVDYLPAVGVMWVLSLLILGSSLGFWRPIVNAKEKPEYPVYVSTVAMILNVVLNYIFILKMGIVGAAIATIISNVFSWITLGFLSKMFFDVFPKIEDIVKPLVASLMMVAVLYKIGLNNLLDGIFAIVFGVLTYFAVIFLVRGLTRDDICYVMRLIKV